MGIKMIALYEVYIQPNGSLLRVRIADENNGLYWVLAKRKYVLLKYTHRDNQYTYVTFVNANSVQMAHDLAIEVLDSAESYYEIDPDIFDELWAECKNKADIPTHLKMLKIDIKKWLLDRQYERLSNDNTYR